MSQYRYNLAPFLKDPTSPFGYPIFDTFDHKKRKVVGLLASNLYWKLYLQNTVTNQARGIICVLRNTGGQAFTYRIDGPKVRRTAESLQFLFHCFDSATTPILGNVPRRRRSARLPVRWHGAVSIIFFLP